MDKNKEQAGNQLAKMIADGAEKKLSEDLQRVYPENMPHNLNPTIKFEWDNLSDEKKQPILELKAGEHTERVITWGVQATTILELIRKLAFKQSINLYIERETREFFQSVKSLKGQMDQLQYDDREDIPLDI